MTYVITQGCCGDGSCVAVCPVQCIRPRPGDPDFTSAEQLYIDPDTCIDCGACLDECPVDAALPDYDLPDRLLDFVTVNADYFRDHPLDDVATPPVRRLGLPPEINQLRVAIVGSGPSACYAAGQLSEIAGVRVTIFERLPTPFGLVRAGVAPDHLSTKLIADRFQTVLARDNVTAFFNVEVGNDLTLDEIRQHHHAVIWAGGASGDRRLGIPGEDLPGSHSAREFIAWYNGHPDHADASFDLRSETAVIIGNGNAALDAARALTQSPSVYRTTDMADHALSALAARGVRRVEVVGRRGPVDGAYSTAELFALTQLDGVVLRAEPAESSITEAELSVAAPQGVSSDLQRKIEIVQAAAQRTTDETPEIVLRYHLTPVEIQGDDKVEAIVLSRPDGATERVETSLVLRSIGSRGIEVPGLPFDDVAGVIPNDRGRVIDPATSSPVPGIYCTGWIKRGPTGIIGSNRTDSSETIESLLADAADGLLAPPTGSEIDLDALVRRQCPDVVDGPGWQRLNAAEKTAGRSSGRPRVKFIRVDEMLAASRI